MHRERDSRGRFVGKDRSLIPTSSLTPPRPRSATPSAQTHIPSIVGIHKLPRVLRSEIQPRDSPSSWTEAIIEEEDATSPTKGAFFLSSIGEQLLRQ